MCKQNINDFCLKCDCLTIVKFTGEKNIVEVIGKPDESFAEYLYECCKCGEQSWVDESRVKDNAVN